MSDSAEDWRHTLTVSGSRSGGYEEKGKDKNGECLDASHYTTTHSEQLMLKVDIDTTEKLAKYCKATFKCNFQELWTIV